MPLKLLTRCICEGDMDREGRIVGLSGVRLEMKRLGLRGGVASWCSIRMVGTSDAADGERCEAAPAVLWCESRLICSGCCACS